ncbi:lysophospholipid acyltransferase family protein [Gloeocapsa sp. PCC 73106]|uniref:lysophospholipid acyltransferase family protein n=1 Tax=Gloeocapsa sp. PCC 73106 TaxID=102232 RepID=UPI0002F95787
MNFPTRSREPWFNLCLYYGFKWSVVAPLFHLYFRGRIEGRENVPQRGPVVVVSNHASYFDPPLLSNCVGRPVAFMAKEELFSIPLLKQGIRLYGAYPVKRGASDRAAIRAALSVLDQGWAVGIFLEGTRTVDSYIHEPKLGAALIAAKAQVPLLPVSLQGTNRIVSLGKRYPQSVPVTVRIGEVIPPPTSTDKTELETVTGECAARINQMLLTLK